MSAHLSDDLPRLLTGEATRQETLAAAEHLRGCPDCRQELVSAVVAHASLASAHRFAPELMVRPASSDADASGNALPDLSTTFDRVRSETGAAPGRRRRALLAVAAAVVLAGGGVTIAETVGSSGQGQPAAQIITLTRVGAPGEAKATISNGAMRIDATSLPPLTADRQYEVWLADNVGQSPRPLGFVGADRTANLPVPRSVMARYSVVAISIQRTNQVAFSGDLAARGSY